MNKVTLHGRVARDPEVRTTQGGQMVARLSIAVDKYSKDGDKKADFVPCIAWGKTAEFLGKYFAKGKEILAEGHITTGSYVDDEGKKRYTTDVVLDRVEFCGSKGEAKHDEQDSIPF